MSVKVDVLTLAAAPIVVRYTGRLRASVRPLEQVLATSAVLWDSSPWNVSGNVGRPKTTSALWTVTQTLLPATSALWYNTSVAETSGTVVLVGETVTLQLTLTLPEGTTPRANVTFSWPGTNSQLSLVRAT